MPGGSRFAAILSVRIQGSGFKTGSHPGGFSSVEEECVIRRQRPSLPELWVAVCCRPHRLYAIWTELL